SSPPCVSERTGLRTASGLRSPVISVTASLGEHPAQACAPRDPTVVTAAAPRLHDSRTRHSGLEACRQGAGLVPTGSDRECPGAVSGPRHLRSVWYYFITLRWSILNCSECGQPLPFSKGERRTGAQEARRPARTQQPPQGGGAPWSASHGWNPA